MYLPVVHNCDQFLGRFRNKHAWTWEPQSLRDRQPIIGFVDNKKNIEYHQFYPLKLYFDVKKQIVQTRNRLFSL